MPLSFSQCVCIWNLSDQLHNWTISQVTLFIQESCHVFSFAWGLGPGTLSSSCSPILSSDAYWFCCATCAFFEPPPPPNHIHTYTHTPLCKHPSANCVFKDKTIFKYVLCVSLQVCVLCNKEVTQISRWAKHEAMKEGPFIHSYPSTGALVFLRSCDVERVAQLLVCLIQYPSQTKHGIAVLGKGGCAIN